MNIVHSILYYLLYYVVIVYTIIYVNIHLPPYILLYRYVIPLLPPQHHTPIGRGHDAPAVHSDRVSGGRVAQYGAGE